MVNSPEQCPKCGGSMEQGFVLDNTYGGRVVSQWARAPPEVVLARHEAPRREARAHRDVPLLILRLPRVVCTAGVRSEIAAAHAALRAA